MKFLTHSMAAVGLIGLAAGVASAGTINVSTGLDASGNLQTAADSVDANWTYDDPYVAAAYSLPASGSAEVVGDNTSADWFGGWVSNGPNSSWIAPDPDVTNNGPAGYTFTTTFDLADTTGASISGAWAIDDGGTLSLNGTVISTLGDGQWGALTSFGDSNAGDFVAGLNTLTVTITDSDQYLEGVDLTGTVTGDLASATPEPSTSVLLLGGLGLAAALYSRKKVRA